MGAKSEQPEQRLLRSFVSAPAQAGERGGSELKLVPHLPPLQGEPGEPANGGRLELRRAGARVEGDVRLIFGYRLFRRPVRGLRPKPDAMLPPPRLSE